jgi:hypothetical protein
MQRRTQAALSELREINLELKLLTNCFTVAERAEKQL